MHEAQENRGTYRLCKLEQVGVVVADGNTVPRGERSQPVRRSSSVNGGAAPCDLRKYIEMLVAVSIDEVVACMTRTKGVS